MKWMLLLILGGVSVLNAPEIKHEVGACSKQRVESHLYINMGPLCKSVDDSSTRARASLPMNVSTHPSYQTTRIHNVSLSGVKKCLRPAIHACNATLEQVASKFNLEALKTQRQFLMDQLSKRSLSIDERVVYSKQIELLIHHYNSPDIQSFITIVETDSHESAKSAVSYLKSRHQMGAFNQDAMRIVDQVYYNRPEMIVERREELTKAESTVREFFCTKDSLIHARNEIQKQQQMLKSGKYVSGKSLTEIEKRVLQKEVELMQQSLCLPGMAAVGGMQRKTLTFSQALWEYKRLGDCSTLVKDAAQAALESYPEYAAYTQAQQQDLALQAAIPLNPDLVLTTPTMVPGISLDVDVKIMHEVQERVTADPAKDFETYMQQMEGLLEEMQQRGELTPVPNRNQEILGMFAKSILERQHPVTQFKDCVSATANLAQWSLSSMERYYRCCMSRPEDIECVRQEMQDFFSTIAAIDPRKLTEEQRARLLGYLVGDVVFFKGFGASLGYLQEIAVLSKTERKLASFVETFDRLVETAPSEVVCVATVDGEVMEVQRKIPLLQRMSGEVVKDVEKVTSSTRTVIKVDKMATFFKETEFGKNLKSKIQKLKGRDYQGQSIYKVMEKNKNSYLKKGDYFYLDAKHMDHLEVFDSQGEFKTILNLDGKVNDNKVRAVWKKGTRDIKDKL